MSTTAISAHAHALLSRISRFCNERSHARFLDRHPELISTEIVYWLSDQVREQAKINPPLATRMAKTAFSIARKLRDSRARAYSLRAMANAFHLGGRNRTAVKYHERACSRFRRLGDTTQVARTLSASIQPLILTGQYGRALSAAKRAARIFIAEGNDRGLARVHINTGNIFHRQDRFSEALAYYQQAYRYFTSDPERDPEALAVASHNVAICFVGLNDFSRAIRAYSECREFAMKHGMRALVGQADYNIAALYHLRGEHSRAIEMLRAASNTCREANDPYHVALCHLDLAQIFLELSQSQQAEEMARLALSEFEQLQMGYESGKSMANLGIALLQQGQLMDALQLFAQAKDVFVREKNKIWAACMDLQRATIFLRLQQTDKSHSLALSARRVFRHARIPYYVIASCVLMSDLYLQMAKPQIANRHCAAAIEQLSKVDLPDLNLQAHHLLGRIHTALGNREDAYICYREARHVLEALRAGLDRDELRISFMRNRLEVYEDLAALCLADSPARTEEAFKCMEQSKSRSLRDLMLRSGSERSPISPAKAPMARKLAELRAEINWYTRRYEAAQLGEIKGSPDLATRLQDEIRTRERAFLRLVRETPESRDDSRSVVPDGAVDLEQIRSTLAPDSTLLEYFEIRGRFFAAVLDRGSFDVVPVCEVAKVNDLIVRLHFQMSKFRLGTDYTNVHATSLLESTKRHLQSLYDALVSPLRKLLTRHHLIVVPHGFLHRLPFHALFDGQQYLLESFRFSYAPSATILDLCCKRPSTRAESALVLGVPDASAPFVSEEASEVSLALPSSQLILGSSATAAALAEKGRQSRIIHIATHGSFRPDEPTFSGIRLGDGLLNLHDLCQMKLSAELVTLSGCSTGLNLVADGDELLGLVRGLIYAGAQSALLTLWDVQDRSTAEFMVSFYRRLLDCHDKSSALQQASLELLNTYRHPYYWAPFVLIGKVITR